MLVSLVAVLALLFIAGAGVEVIDLHFVFGVIFPYAAFGIFVFGVAARILQWAGIPVPFRIPTTCGQQRSLSWIKTAPLDNPHTKLGVVGRMLLEVLFFRSLLRNTRTQVKEGPKIVYGSSEWLWLFALVFHWSMLFVAVRHVLRFFVEPSPQILGMIESADGFFQVGSPPVLITGLLLLGALGFLLLRRLMNSQVRYISLVSDYFPLFLLIAIAATGLLLRHFVRADIVGVKELTVGLVTFDIPGADVMKQVHWLFYSHLFLVCVLLVYIPFSKLMHLGGVFLSPTRNMANTNREVRHINPWGKDQVVPERTYEAYEDDFRDKMIQVGLPVDKKE